MEKQVELRKVYGDVFFTAKRIDEGTILQAQWYGLQSVETVKEGGTKLLEMIREKPYIKLLNCNKNVVGSWDMAHDWVENTWTPQMKAAGLRYIAQVVPTSIYATLSIETLIQRIDNKFEIRIFKEDSEAREWLRSVAV